KKLSAETLDGHIIHLQGNIELPEEVPSVEDHGGTGIGLYRTEFLFMNRPDLPTEEEHYNACRYVAEKAFPYDVVIRTFDVGGEKLALPEEYEKEANPALGLRAIRFCLQKRDIFKTQLRGILRATAHGKIKLLLPMISGLAELRETKQIIDEVKAELRNEERAFNEQLDLGIMIEIPSAAMVADLLAREVSFFSVGTNDLIQYTMAIDRLNEHVAYMYEPLEPAVLRLLQRVSEAARDSKIQLAMCGEMAGDPLYAAILIGMGFEYLSMNVAAIPWVKRVIRSVRMQDAVELAALVLQQSTAALAKKAAVRFMEDRFPDLAAEL
ncbi:MAG TPA: phosphoenolpyruvate--protein phosphotransferase, partial [Nitrospirota bacterium]|nr:phosphoenolpyruvate--protein phosphotransferase [Nitrospirota bacterium]